jgi:hypothetical protein
VLLLPCTATPVRCWSLPSSGTSSCSSQSARISLRRYCYCSRNVHTEVLPPLEHSFAVVHRGATSLPLLGALLGRSRIGSFDVAIAAITAVSGALIKLPTALQLLAYHATLPPLLCRLYSNVSPLTTLASTAV